MASLNSVDPVGVAYLLTFPNGKAYVGITRHSIQDRVTRHRRSATSIVGRALRKFKSVGKQILLRARWSYLLEFEQLAIASFRTKFPSGYNITDGGEGMIGVPVSNERRRAVSVFHKGRKRLPETCARIAEVQRSLDRVYSEAGRKAISDTHKGNKYSLGLKRSKETKLKQSSRKRLWWASLAPQERKEFCAMRAAKGGRP